MAASMEPASIPQIDWLYPELLSKEGLIEILSQRFVKLPEDVESATKDSLLELYYRYIIPRPQRQYRLNRRGREMTKKQILRAKKRKALEKDSSEPAAKKSANSSSRLLTSFESVSIGSRLKPPPSCVNFEKKVIKLGSSKSSGDSSVSSASNNSSTVSTTGSKVIKLNRSSASAENEVKSPTTSKTITLNRTVKPINSHIGCSGDATSSAAKFRKEEKSDASQSDKVKQKQEKMETDEEPAPAKKPTKIKRISWP